MVARPAFAQRWAVAIVSSERGGAYEEASEALREELARAGVTRAQVLELTAADLASAALPEVRLVVTLGTAAAQKLARWPAKAPVLCTLLPQVSFERVLAESGRQASAQFSALYLNQPLTRQLDLARLALPHARRIGVLWGEQSVRQKPALAAVARARGLDVRGVEVKHPSPVFSGLKQIVEDADLLLAMADPQIYNRDTIQNILLTSFRARVPMLAFSPAYVRAGALLAVYSTPAQIGRQAGSMAMAVLQGAALGPVQYPQDFTVAVNVHVARAFQLELDEEGLTRALKQQERGP